MNCDLDLGILFLCQTTGNYLLISGNNFHRFHEMRTKLLGGQGVGGGGGGAVDLLLYYTVINTEPRQLTTLQIQELTDCIVSIP